MNKTFFDQQGKCLIGTMKGLHASKIRSGWVEWAKKEIKGFEEQFKKALTEKQTKPTGRNYTIRRWTKKTQ